MALWIEPQSILEGLVFVFTSISFCCSSTILLKLFGAVDLDAGLKVIILKRIKRIFSI